MTPLDLVKLTPLLGRTSGKPHVKIGLIDGPVAMNHPELAQRASPRDPWKWRAARVLRPRSTACLHGTFVAGILCAKRDSSAPAICPDCTLLARPYFCRNDIGKSGNAASATPEELAQAILDCIDAGARVLNVSAALAQPSIKSERGAGRGAGPGRQARE